MEFVQSADFWIGLVKIVWINIILSGDNAVVIALAARSLPPHQQRKAVFWGSGAAVVLRIALTVVAAKLLQLSFDHRDGIDKTSGAGWLTIARKSHIIQPTRLRRHMMRHEVPVQHLLQHVLQLGLQLQ